MYMILLCKTVTRVLGRNTFLLADLEEAQVLHLCAAILKKQGTEGGLWAKHSKNMRAEAQQPEKN